MIVIVSLIALSIITPAAHGVSVSTSASQQTLMAHARRTHRQVLDVAAAKQQRRAANMATKATKAAVEQQRRAANKASMVSVLAWIHNNSAINSERQAVSPRVVRSADSSTTSCTTASIRRDQLSTTATLPSTNPLTPNPVSAPVLRPPTPPLPPL